MRGIENSSQVVRSAPRDPERALACEAVNRVASRGFIHRQLILVAFERKARIRNPSRPWEQQRDTAAMRMCMPCVWIGRARNDFEHAYAIAEALASGLRNDHGAFALSFKRD